MFHKTNLGAFAERLTADLNGMVPERDDPYGSGSWPNGWDWYDSESDRMRWEEIVEAGEQAAREADRWSDRAGGGS